MQKIWNRSIIWNMRKYGIENFMITVYVLNNTKYSNIDKELSRMLKIHDSLVLKQYFYCYSST